MTLENDLKQSLNGGESQEESTKHAFVSQLEKDHLASQRCKAFMQIVRETNVKLRNNPEAQMEQAKKLW